MTRHPIILLALTLAIALRPATAADTEMTPELSAVTVYSTGALMSFSTDLELPEGVSYWHWQLPPYSGARLPTVITGDGATVEMLEVLDLPPIDQHSDADFQAAQRQVDIRQAEYRLAQAQLERLAQETAYLRRLISGEAPLPKPAADDKAQAGFVDTHTYIAERLTALKDAELAAAEAALDAEAALNEAQAALRDLRFRAEAPRRLLRVGLRAAAAGSLAAELQVATDEAHWIPTYVLRADLDAGDDGHVLVDRQALVRQASGMDWQGVAIRVTTDSLPRRAPALPAGKERQYSDAQLHAVRRLEDFREEAEQARSAAAADGQGIDWASPEKATVMSDGSTAVLPIARLRVPVARKVVAAIGSSVDVQETASLRPEPGQLLAIRRLMVQRGGAFSELYRFSQALVTETAYIDLMTESDVTISRSVQDLAPASEGAPALRRSWTITVENTGEHERVVDLNAPNPAALPGAVLEQMEPRLASQGQTLRWSVTVPPGASRDIRYTVRYDR